ncbi:MAG: flagellar biosynthetic protein FliR [Candidatus Cloacimonadota bacterium]|nr:flagellar biosynthetic protein FliR [Candidatus Cloacimonadota bacterium]
MPEIPLEKIEVFLLILFRVSTMLILMPVFSSKMIPGKIKIAISLFIAYILFPTIATSSAIFPLQNILQFFILAVQEIFIGITVAFVWHLLFFSLRIAGSITGFQMGFFVASVIDPNDGSQTPIISELYFIAGMLIFFAINGQHRLIESLIYSFEKIPFGNLFAGQSLLNNLTGLFQATFIFALQIAFPIMATLLLVEISFGFITRVAPQMNIFMVSFPLKIGIGIFILMYSMPFLRYIFSRTYNYFSVNVITIIKILGSG